MPDRCPAWLDEETEATNHERMAEMHRTVIRGAGWRYEEIAAAVQPSRATIDR